MMFNIFYIFSYLLPLILAFYQFVSVDCMLLIGCLIDILFALALLMLYVSSFIQLLVDTQHQLLYKDSLTSMINNEQEAHRDTMHTLLSIPTSAETVEDDESSHNMYALSAISSNETHEMQPRPPLNLHISGNSQLAKQENQNQNEAAVAFLKAMDIDSDCIARDVSYFSKYTALSALLILLLVIVVAILFVLQMQRECAWHHELGCFVIAIYCFVSCVAIYLGLKHNEKKYRKCCAKWDAIWKNAGWKYATWRFATNLTG